MIRNRLAKLEKLAAERAANCPACVRIPVRILMPGDPDLAPDDLVRCEVCGRERVDMPAVKLAAEEYEALTRATRGPILAPRVTDTVRIVVPGMGSAPMAALD